MGELGEFGRVTVGLSQRRLGIVAARADCVGNSFVADFARQSRREFQMITLLHPIWLALAIPIGALWFLWRYSSRLLRYTRLASLALILLGLCGLAIKLPSRNGTIIIAADRSLSMPQGAEGAQKELIDLIE